MPLGLGGGDDVRCLLGFPEILLHTPFKLARLAPGARAPCGTAASSIGGGDSITI